MIDSLIPILLNISILIANHYRDIVKKSSSNILNLHFRISLACERYGLACPFLRFSNYWIQTNDRIYGGSLIQQFPGNHNKFKILINNIANIILIAFFQNFVESFNAKTNSLVWQHWLYTVLISLFSFPIFIKWTSRNVVLH